MIGRIIAVVAISLSLIQAGDVGGRSGGFLRIGTTARSLAMGGGMTAAIDRGFAAYHNPAVLSFLEKRHVSVLHHFLPLDRYLVSTAFASSLPPTGGIGLGFVNAGVDGIDGRDQAGHPTGTLSTGEYAIYFSFSNRLVESMSVGVNVKLLYQVIPEEGKQTGTGIGVDVGFLIQRFEKLDLGLVIQDINTAYVWNTSELFEEKGRTYRDSFPRQLRFGVAYHPGLVDIVGDYTYVTAGKSVVAHRIRLGGEYRPMAQVAVRAGIDNFSPTVGAGLNYSLLKRNDARVDYAFLLGRRGEGIAHVFTYVFTF